MSHVRYHHEKHSSHTKCLIPPLWYASNVKHIKEMLSLIDRNLTDIKKRSQSDLNERVNGKRRCCWFSDGINAVELYGIKHAHY